jgi:hypothetical protein
VSRSKLHAQSLRINRRNELQAGAPNQASTNPPSHWQCPVTQAATGTEHATAVSAANQTPTGPARVPFVLPYKQKSQDDDSSCPINAVVVSHTHPTLYYKTVFVETL